jgi:hypothetical protein
MLGKYFPHETEKYTHTHTHMTIIAIQISMKPIEI